MSDRYERIARRVIARHGMAADLVSVTVTGGDGSPFNPGVETETLTPVTAAFSEVERAVQSASAISLGKRVAYLTHEGLVPTTAMTLRVDGTDYMIASVNTHAPDGEPRFHVVELNS